MVLRAELGASDAKVINWHEGVACVIFPFCVAILTALTANKVVR